MTALNDQIFAERRSNVASAARNAELDGLLICSRGAGTNERHANSLYFANAYSTFPFIPDNPPAWSGRGHTVLLLTADGEELLLLDVAHFPADGVAIDNVKTCQRVVEDTIEGLDSLGLATGRVGLAGTDVMPTSWFWKISEALPDLDLVPADELVNATRAVKSSAEHALLRQACERGVDVMNAILHVARPGVSKGEVMGVGLDGMARHGLMPYDLRLSTGAQLSSSSLAGMPGRDYDTELRKGELFRVDLVATHRGYYVDFARSIVLGQEPDADQQRMLDAVRESVYSVINALEPGISGDELAKIGRTKLGEFDLAPPDDPSKNKATGFASFGHGLGLAWERPWLNLGSEDRVEAGMCIAVEQKVGIDGIGGATFEENVLVLDNHLEVMTSKAPHGAAVPQSNKEDHG